MEKLYQLRQTVRGLNLNEEEAKSLLRSVMSESLYTEYDEGYLRAMLFPEFSPACRIPTPFGAPSTLSTQRFSFYVNTGGGDGAIIFTPQDFTQYCVFRTMNGVSSDTVNFPPWNGSNQNLHCLIPVNESKITSMLNAFIALRLVGASIRISYTGTVEGESGMLCASHIYDKRIVENSEKAVEEGFFVTRARPHEGVRLVYQPKDNKDFEYQETNRMWDVNSGNPTLTETCGSDVFSVFGLSPSAVLLGGVSTNDQLNELVDYRQFVWMMPGNLANANQYATGTTNVLGWQQLGVGFNAGDQAQVLPLETMIGMGPRIGNGACPQQLVCYFKGLPLNQNYLRVDVVRHFEAIPRTAVKDIVSVDRPVESEETIKIATKIGPKIPFLNSSTLQMASPLFAGISNALSQGGSVKNMIHNAAQGAAQAVGMAAKTAVPIAAGFVANEVIPGSGGLVAGALKGVMKTTQGYTGGGQVATYNQIPTDSQAFDFLQQSRWQ